MSQAVLPTFLRPKHSEHLRRIGRANDGGYLVDARDIENSDGVIGLGLNDDWSFEKDFYAEKKVPIFAYDASVSLVTFLKQFVKAVPRIDKPLLLFRRARTVVDYKRFFRAKRRHIIRFIGIDSDPLYTSLSNAMDEFERKTGAKNKFLKIDIEGWEYRILDDLVAEAENITGLVIEFHDIDLHLDRIKSFVEAFPLTLIHTHCNNSAPINGQKIPLIIECTFTSSEINDPKGVNTLPNKLDMPNIKLRSDYEITFN